MEKTVKMHLMGEFEILTAKESISLASRSRKGAALIEFLILNNGKKITSQRLSGILWSEYLHANPMSALKTLVSRVRKLLNEISEGLGSSIVSERGYYWWQSLPGVEVDLLEIIRIFEEIGGAQGTREVTALYEKLLTLYQGDLYITGNLSGDTAYQTALHKQYLNAVYDYVDLLMQSQSYNDAIRVLGQALTIDELDERLHMELMRAQVENHCVDEAMAQFRRVSDLNRKYLDAEPSEEMAAFYRKITSPEQSLNINLDTILLALKDPSQKEAAICNVEEFRSIFHVLWPTLERLGCRLFLGLIMLDFATDAPAQEKKKIQAELMEDLTRIASRNLRKGDVVTQYTDAVTAILLPGVNHTTGNMIMERIRYEFFSFHPKQKVSYHYRIGEMDNTGLYA